MRHDGNKYEERLGVLRQAWGCLNLGTLLSDPPSLVYSFASNCGKAAKIAYIYVIEEMFPLFTTRLIYI
jgi:hypothetical protein